MIYLSTGQEEAPTLMMFGNIGSLKEQSNNDIIKIFDVLDGLCK